MKVIKKSGSFMTRRQPVSERTTAGITPLFEPPDHENNGRADANYVGQLLSWQIAGKYTYDLQFNIQYIVDALNNTFSSVSAKEIIGSSLHHSNMSLWTADKKFTFDLKLGVINKLEFMRRIKELVESGEVIGEY